MRVEKARWTQRSLMAAGLMLLLAFVSSVPGYTVFRCRFDSIARRACCCPANPIQAPKEGASVSKGCCCDQETVTVPRAPCETQHAGLTGIPSPPPALVIWYLPPPAPAMASHPGTKDRRQTTGPPVLQLKHSLLL